jgi:integrase
MDNTERKPDPRQRIQADTSELKEIIMRNRPTVARTTVATYLSVLKNLFYSVHDPTEKINVDWFRDQDAVLKAVESHPVRSRKTYLSAVLVINNGRFNDKILEKVAEDRETTKKMDSSNEKTPKQAEAWMDYDEVKEVWNQSYGRVKHLLNSRSTITRRPDLNELADFMLLTLTTGIFFPPRRSEWAQVKIKNFDATKDNYVDIKNGTIVLNCYKTCKTYGPEKVLLPKEFKAILKKYLAVLPETQENLLYDSHDKPTNSVKVAHRLNTLFGRKISTSMLRHIYASKRAEMLPALREIQADAEKMGHSLAQHIDYIKK